MAASFFAKLLDSPAPETRVAVDRWLASDPRNVVAFARIEFAWDRAAALRLLAPSPDRDERTDKVFPQDRCGDQ